MTHEQIIAKTLGVTPAGLDCLCRAVANHGVAEGARAFRDARPATANPYPVHTTSHELWRDGWERALDLMEKTR